MRQTSNLRLALYEASDKMNITGAENSLNHNMELIDAEIAKTMKTPETGETGQILTKTEAGFEWRDAPTGGGSGDSENSQKGEEITETIDPVWEAGRYYFNANKELRITTENLHAVIQCHAGDKCDISMRTQAATIVQPLILTRKLLDDESFNYSADVIYAKNLEADQNPYKVTLNITEDCYLYINRKEITTSFPFSMQRTYIKYTEEVLPDTSDKDKLNIYVININEVSGDTSSVVKTEEGYEITIKKTATGFIVPFDTSALPVSDRMMLTYKITPVQMDVEKFNYNFFGNYYRNRNCRSIYKTGIGVPKTEYMALERMSETPAVMNFGTALGSSTLQGLSVYSAYTNGAVNEYLSDDDTLVKFLVSDIRAIDFSKSLSGYEISTNLEYHIDDVFAENIYVDEKDYAKHERNIYGIGDSIMMATKYRDLSWIQQLYIPGYKLNIDYDKTNEGHISNKTRNSEYSAESYTAGFVDKIVKDSASVGDDITIFALGIHDHSQNSQGTGYCRLGSIGKTESDGNYNWCTVAGAIETILKKVTSDPNKRFLWVDVAAKGYGLDSDGDYSVREENEVIKQACSNWGVQVSDVFGKMGMNPSNIGGNNIWDGSYTDGYKYDDTGVLTADELYFVTDAISVDATKQYRTLWVSSGDNKCYMSCFDSDGNWIRNNAAGWGILPDGTATIKYNVPKASSVEEMTTIVNSYDHGFVSEADDALTTDAVHLTDKSYKRYLNVVNEDVEALVRQDE